jgi:hypothetical protein
MAVYCSHCGEELLGAVNRCWKCGRTFSARLDPSGLPPIRRPPLTGSLDAADFSETGALVAEVLDEGLGVAGAADAQAAPATRAADAAVKIAIAHSPQSAEKKRPPRCGSPFAVSDRAAPDRTAPPRSPAVAQPRRKNAGAAGAAIAAVVLGVLGLVLSYYFTIGALLISLAGLGLGVWGLYSEHRGLAILAVLLCCLALSISAFHGAVDLYTNLYGSGPWQSEFESVVEPDVVE